MRNPDRTQVDAGAIGAELPVLLRQAVATIAGMAASTLRAVIRVGRQVALGGVAVPLVRRFVQKTRAAFLPVPGGRV